MHISSPVLPKGVVVGQNEDFIVYILSNTFDVTRKNYCIISLEVTKNSTTFRSKGSFYSVATKIPKLVVYHTNPFYATVLFTPPENIRKHLLFCCFREYKKRPVA